MIYFFFKPLIHIAFRIYFRKAYFSNKKRIPKGRAVIFAVNHPTAFLDPVFVGAYVWPVTHFVLRGDVFTTPFIKWILRQIKTIPIFRARDGFSNLRSNQNTFNHLYELLNKGKNILILAEGETKHEKRLRPIQKGTARMVTGLYEIYPEAKVCVLPIGVNYTAANEIRSELMADVGTPIYLEDYKEVYAENPRKAVKLMTDEISNQLKARVIHVKEDEDAPFVDRLLDFRRNDRNKILMPFVSDSTVALEEEMKIVDQVNAMEAEDKLQLRKKVEQYDAFLNKHQLKDVGLARPGFFSFVNSITLLLGIPILVLGMINNWIPFTLGKKVADAKVKKPSFYGSVRFAVALLSYLLLFVVAFTVLLIVAPWWCLAGIFIMPVAGYLSLVYQDLFVRWRSAFKWRGVAAADKAEMWRLRADVLKL